MIIIGVDSVFIVSRARPILKGVNGFGQSYRAIKFPVCPLSSAACRR